MQEQKYHSDWSHLFLTGWPFQTTPDEVFAQIWVDRSTLKEQINQLVWKWSRQDRGYIQLMWSNLGAGKSHTLMHIKQHCNSHPETGILPIYTVMPKEIRGFIDVYQSIMAGIDIDLLAKMFVRAYQDAGSKKAIVSQLFPSIPDACDVLRKMQSEIDSTRRLAKEWLMGQRLTRGQLNTLEANRYIRTSDDCVAMLCGIVHLVQITKEYRRILIMVDECQRMWEYKLTIGQGINIGLQTWYDSSPNHLTLMLSFKCGQEKHVYKLISEDLRSRSDPPSISLPLLTPTEALEFVNGLFEHFGTDNRPSPLFPFSLDMVYAVLKYLTKSGGVSPRVLMHAFSALLEDADYQIGTTGQFNMETSEAIRIIDAVIRELQDEED